MKKRILLFTSSIVLFAALTMSYEQGPAHYANSNYTGGPGSFGSTCGMGGCHTSTTGTTTIAIDVRKASDNSPATAYLGDTTYIIKITGDNTNANLTHFGFQFMALEAANTTNNAGTFGTFPNDVDDDLAFGDTRIIVEHTEPLPQTGGQYEVEFEWMAPSTGFGTVNMYAIINAVNNNNSADNIDRPSAPFTLALPEATTSVSKLSANLNINAYPNPVIDRLNLEIANAGNYAVKVIDMNGKIVNRQTIDGKATIDTRSWAPGLYQVQLSNDDATHTISVLK